MSHAPSSLRRLASDDVQLWTLEPEALASERRRSACEAWLCEDEAQRYARLRSASARAQFLATRTLVRSCLSFYADVDPAEWRFDREAGGKPVAAGPRRCDTPAFNLSNTAGLVVCAVAASGDVGVDVEALARPVEATRLAARFFAPSEQAQVAEREGEARRQRFLELWTLKEAWLKARAEGLRRPLSSFSFALEPGAPPRLRVGGALEGDPGRGLEGDLRGDVGGGLAGEREEARWRFWQATLASGHVVAVALDEHKHERSAGALAVEVRSLLAAVDLSGGG